MNCTWTIDMKAFTNCPKEATTLIKQRGTRAVRPLCDDHAVADLAIARRMGYRGVYAEALR